MDAYTWLTIVTSEKSVWNYNLHIALILSSKSYYSLVKSIDINKFFDARWFIKHDGYYMHTVCGVAHNIFRPTIVKCDDKGMILIEKWYHNNKIHREDGPAWIEYYNDGKTRYMTWHQNGILHRKDGPARIEYHNDGNVLYKAWYYDGRLMCDEMPAAICFYKNGITENET